MTPRRLVVAQVSASAASSLDMRWPNLVGSQRQNRPADTRASAYKKIMSEARKRVLMNTLTWKCDRSKLPGQPGL